MKKICKISVFFCLILTSFLCIFGIIVVQKKFFSKSVYAMVQETSVKISNEKEKYNINEIIEKNTKEVITEVLETEEKDVEFTTRYVQSDKIAKGTILVEQEGIDGKELVTTKKTYINGELSSQEVVSAKLVKSQLEKIVQVGTGPTSLKFTINVGDKAYATSNLLTIYSEASKDSKKIITIAKQSEVIIIEINDEWIKVKYGNYIGWIQKNCITKNNPVTEEKTENSKTKDEILNELNENMELNKRSGLTLEQFKKVLTENSQDKQNVFNENYEYFYYAEEQYNVNGIFLAAVAIHESNWGTSQMAQNKKNLFGYGAYDSNPSDNAYKFDTYAQGIDLLARVFAKYYLNPQGTSIYNNEKASGSHYNGATVAGVNKHYATDKNWSNAVYKWMQYLYNKI